MANTVNTSVQQTASVADHRVRVAAATAFLIGAAIVFMTGFAHSETLHDVAHDTRHSLAFPCH
jgi:cobalt transporter subunit CbtB